jgi:hypothetical protein
VNNAAIADRYAARLGAVLAGPAEVLPVVEPDPTPIVEAIEVAPQPEILAPERPQWRPSSTTRSHGRRFASRLAGRGLNGSPRTGNSVRVGTARHAAADAADDGGVNGVGTAQRPRVQAIPKRDLPAVAQVLRAKNPKMTHVEIGARLGVTERTVGAWLKAPTAEQPIVRTTGKTTGTRMGFQAPEVKS